MDKAYINFLKFYRNDWREWQFDLKWQKAVNNMLERGMRNGQKIHIDK